MRKLMVMLAAVALAGAVRAEATFSVVGLSAYYGWSAYHMVEQSFSSYSTLNPQELDSSLPVPALQGMFVPSSLDDSYGTWAEYYADLGMEEFALAPISDSGTTSYTSGNDGTWGYLMIGLFKDDVTPGSEFVVMRSYSAESDTTHTIDFSSADRTKTILTGTLNADAVAVPEPTSGLLLLVGGALLALRRKRA